MAVSLPVLAPIRWARSSAGPAASLARPWGADPGRRPLVFGTWWSGTGRPGSRGREVAAARDRDDPWEEVLTLEGGAGSRQDPEPCETVRDLDVDQARLRVGGRPQPAVVEGQ